MLLPVAEIVRRCFWGVLLLERKTIQMTEDDAVYSRLDSSATDGEGSVDDVNEDDDEVDQLSGGDHSQAGKGAYHMYLPLWLNAQQQMQHETSNHSSLWPSSTIERFRSFTSHFDCGEDFMHNLFVCELGLWAVAFVGLGCWAAS